MRWHKIIICSILICIAAGECALCDAQDGYATPGGKVMPFIVEGGDTVYLSPLATAHIYEKKKRKRGRAWRKYYRLVYNFAKVYPFALVAKDIVHEVDSTITKENMRFVRKDAYVNKIVKDLFNSFEKPIRNMTVTQGALLMKLIDRECGIAPYTIIKEFKNVYAATFWQGVARLFGNDLKKPYDPAGTDEAVEELVRQWENGTFEKTYYEIFWKYPPMTELPEKYRTPDTNASVKR